MSKKILILANNSGGLYSFRKELIAELAKTCEIVASTPFDDKIDELQSIGCRLIKTDIDRRGLNPFKDLLLLFRYKRIIKKEKPDLVITYTIKPNIYGGIVCRRRDVQYAANITGLGTAFENQGIVRKIVVKLYKIALKRAKVVFFENSSNRELFIKSSIIEEEKTCLLNGAGVNLDWFCVQAYPNNRVFKFLFIGRIMKEKGIEELFSAMQKLKNDGIECSLDVLGSFDEDYSDRIKQLEVAGLLVYHGFQPDVRPFISDCDCFILPSYHEGMANTNLECAACGRPIITSNIPGCKEAVVDNATGFLCKPQSTEDLFLKMKKMISLSYTDRMKMGLIGRKHMETNFDKKVVVEKTLTRLFD